MESQSEAATSMIKSSDKYSGRDDAKEGYSCDNAVAFDDGVVAGHVAESIAHAWNKLKSSVIT